MATDRIYRIVCWGPDQPFDELPMYDRMLCLAEMEAAGLHGVAERVRDRDSGGIAEKEARPATPSNMA